MASQQVVMFGSVNVTSIYDSKLSTEAQYAMTALALHFGQELGYLKGQNDVLRETRDYDRAQITIAQDAASTAQALLHSALVSSSEATAKLQNDISALTAKIAKGNTLEKKVFQKQLTKATEQLAAAQESEAAAKQSEAAAQKTATGSADKAKIAVLETKNSALVDENTQLKALILELQNQQSMAYCFAQGQQSAYAGGQQSWVESPQPVQSGANTAKNYNKPCKIKGCNSLFTHQDGTVVKCKFQHTSS